MMPSPFLSTILLAAFAAGLAYFWDPSSVLDFHPTDTPKTLANTYLINTSALTYSAQGSLTEILKASDVRHFPKQKRTEITAPRYYSHNGNNRTWSVTSEHGRFLDQPELLVLEGNVVLTDDLNEGHLYTEVMRINLKKKIASSKVPVTVTQGRNTTTAKGMVADLNKEQLRLMTDVESIYVPAIP